MRIVIIVSLHFTLMIAGGCATNPRYADTFSHQGVLNGSRMAPDVCRWRETSVWVTVDGQGECVRYFQMGLQRTNGIVHVWFHGDRLWHKSGLIETRGYRDNTPAALQRQVRRAAVQYDLPYIRLSRPGVYGSSGDHKQRRRARETQIVNAALDAIKRKYDIGNFHLSGQSSGGHVVAALLPLRDDIRCAVITSGVVAVAQRNAQRGWSSDITGYHDFYDPIDHIGEIPIDPALRIFIVGDPRDSNVPFDTQAAYQKTLKDAGHAAWLVEASATGSRHHSLDDIGHQIVKWCHDGVPPEAIITNAKELTASKA